MFTLKHLKTLQHVSIFNVFLTVHHELTIY